MAFRSKGTQQVPVPTGTTVVSNVQTDGSSVVTPGGYNESYSGGYQYAAGNVTTGVAVKNTYGRLCRVHCQAAPAGGITVTAYDLAATPATGTPVYGPVQVLPGCYVSPMLPMQNGIVLVVAGTGAQWFCGYE